MSSTLRIFLEHPRSLKILQKGDLKQDDKSFLLKNQNDGILLQKISEI